MHLLIVRAERYNVLQQETRRQLDPTLLLTEEVQTVVVVASVVEVLVEEHLPAVAVEDVNFG